MGTRPVWAEISLEPLAGNYRSLRRAAQAAGAFGVAGALSFPGSAGAPPTPRSADSPEMGSHGPELLAVVKANAYGHGLELCGPALAAAGARWLGVTSAEEGVALRRALGVLPGPLSAARILVMSSLWEGEADAVLERALTPQVWEPYQFELLRAAARRRGLGAGAVAVHLEIDTGMARQGVRPGPALAALLERVAEAGSPLRIEGVMTHLSAPEMLEQSGTDEQLGRFGAALEQLAAAGVRPDWVHVGNSATVVDAGRHRARAEALTALTRRWSPAARLMLRPGLALYGYPTRFTPAGQAPDQSGLEPVLAWKTRITSLRTIGVGEGAGYNSVFRAGRPSRLALVPVGYADGLNRLLSGRAAMLVRGQRAPIAGRISMDQTILDVTEVPGAAIGEEVVILGEQSGEKITAWEHAELCGTIPYEIVCAVAARVPRVPVE